MKISVIIPIYNSEKYLKECIESVLDQNYLDLEIILIDDGSTDNSKLICEEYVQTYDNIALYCQTNQGASAARNLGIKKHVESIFSFLTAMM